MKAPPEFLLAVWLRRGGGLEWYYQGIPPWYYCDVLLPAKRKLRPPPPLRCQRPLDL